MRGFFVVRKSKSENIQRLIADRKTRRVYRAVVYVSMTEDECDGLEWADAVIAKVVDKVANQGEHAIEDMELVEYGGKVVCEKIAKPVNQWQGIA